MQALPTSMKQHLILQADQSLTNLARQADKLGDLSWENEVHLIEPTTAVNTDILQAIKELQVEINRINLKTTKTDDNSMCYYHRRFGAQANKCQKPCTWVTEIKMGKDEGSH